MEKTIPETVEALGVSRATVYNLLKRGVLVRSPARLSGNVGRPVTMVTVNSISRYIKAQGGQ
jgi:hypothetical protein